MLRCQMIVFEFNFQTRKREREYKRRKMIAGERAKLQSFGEENNLNEINDGQYKQKRSLNVNVSMM
jgi:hypothetical protein